MRRLLSLSGTLAVLIALPVLSRCEYERPPGGPPGGYEMDDQSCADGFDNDGDGMVDCDDPDCLVYSVYCGEQVPYMVYIEDEPPDLKKHPHLAKYVLSICHDFIDNDWDGNYDCGDRECQAIPESCCPIETGDAACSDRIDNDQNSYADCEDFNCKKFFSDVCKEGPENASCLDGADNDGNGLADCDDPECAGIAGCTETACNDGLDNDRDGLADCKDPDCTAWKICVETECGNQKDDEGDGKTDCLDPDCATNAACKGDENTLLRCQDGIDNDSNGYTDCNDWSCSKDGPEETVQYCASLPAENTAETCTDGVDNDVNGYTDCNDFSCSKSTEPDVVAACEALSESTEEKCKDGVDNDGDGYTDCEDWSCTDATKGASEGAIAYCDTLPAEETVEECSDGKDNDGNGYTDCGDWSCSKSTDSKVLAYCDTVLENSFARCIDGVDNDGNGYTDCEDFSCNDKGVAQAACQESWVPESELPAEYASAVEAGDQQEALRIAAEAVRARCADGKDNDLDGFTDCADWDCGFHPSLAGDPTFCAERRACE